MRPGAPCAAPIAAIFGTRPRPDSEHPAARSLSAKRLSRPTKPATKAATPPAPRLEAPPRPRPAAPQRARRRLVAASWLVAIIAMLVALTAAGMFVRHRFSAVWPSAARLYASTGQAADAFWTRAGDQKHRTQPHRRRAHHRRARSQISAARRTMSRACAWRSRIRRKRRSSSKPSIHRKHSCNRAKPSISRRRSPTRPMQRPGSW